MEIESKTIGQIREIGGDKLLRRLIELFVENTPMRLEEMRRAIAGSNAKRAALAAHSLRSSSVTLGAHELAERAGAVEALANEEKLGIVEDALPELEKLVAGAQESLQSIVEG